MLYDADKEECLNYCTALQGKRRRLKKRSAPLSSGVVLPKLAGHVECGEHGNPIKINVCSFGTHYDETIKDCRNFCAGVTSPREFVPFPDRTGGVTCVYEEVSETRWCTVSGTSFDETWGACVSVTVTEPSDSPETTTIFSNIVSSTIAMNMAPRVPPTTSEENDLMVPLVDDSNSNVKEEETKKTGKKVTKVMLVTVESSEAIAMSSRSLWTLPILLSLLAFP